MDVAFPIIVAENGFRCHGDGLTENVDIVKKYHCMGEEKMCRARVGVWVRVR